MFSSRNTMLLVLMLVIHLGSFLYTVWGKIGIHFLLWIEVALSSFWKASPFPRWITLTPFWRINWQFVCLIMCGLINTNSVSEPTHWKRSFLKMIYFSITNPFLLKIPRVISVSCAENQWIQGSTVIILSPRGGDCSKRWLHSFTGYKDGPGFGLRA